MAVIVKPGCTTEIAATVTTALFDVQPPGNTWTIEVQSTAWMTVDGLIFIPGAGIFTVTAIIDPTLVSVNYPALAQNTHDGDTIPAGTRVTPTTGLVVVPGCAPDPLNDNLAAYYKFDELTEGTGPVFEFSLRSPDYLGVCDLDTLNASGDPLLVDGLIGSAVNFPSNFINIGLNNGDPALFSDAQKAQFNIYQQSFTLRFWMRLLQAGTGGVFMEVRLSGAPTFCWRFTIASSTNKVTFRLFTQTVTSTEAIPIDGEFHRVIVSRDYANLLISIKIDDNPTLTAAYTGTDSNTGLDFFFIGNTAYAFDIDEWGLWKDLVWTEENMTYDWNAGAGKTPPFN